MFSAADDRRGDDEDILSVRLSVCVCVIWEEVRFTSTLPLEQTTSHIRAF
jgi:hypothetical protein